MRIDLTDKVALVTGAVHRVGCAIALELAKNGFIDVKQNNVFGNIFVKLKKS